MAQIKDYVAFHPGPCRRDQLTDAGGLALVARAEPNATKLLEPHAFPRRRMPLSAATSRSDRSRLR
jgi:hypothetical protein